MSKQVPWNKIILEEFVKSAMLTKDEELILRTRIAGWPISRQAMEFNISESTVNRIIKRLKQKYDNAEKYNPLLPPRKTSADETWINRH